MRTRVLVAALVATTAISVATIVSGAVIGASEAPDHRVAGLTIGEEAVALRSARDFWDNPFQRMGYFSMAVTSVAPPNAHGCRVVQVTAYSFFGRAASTVEIGCDQGQQIVMSDPGFESRAALAGSIAVLGVLVAAVGTYIGALIRRPDPPWLIGAGMVAVVGAAITWAVLP